MLLVQQGCSAPGMSHLQPVAVRLTSNVIARCDGPPHMQCRVQGGAAGSPLMLKAAGGMGCTLSVVAVRDVGSGRASLLELRANFFQGGVAPQVRFGAVRSS